MKLLISIPISNRKAKVLDWVISSIKMAVRSNGTINVVNMNSSQENLDGYKEVCKKNKVRLIDVVGESEFVKTIAMNAGFAHAGTDFTHLLSSDVDCMWTPQLGLEIVSKLEEDSDRALMIRATYLPKEYRMKPKEALYSFLNRARLDRVVKKGLLAKNTSPKQTNGTGHVICSKVLFEKLNGHDERYRGWGREDDEWYDRVSWGGSNNERCAEYLLHYWHEKNWFNASQNSRIKNDALYKDLISGRPKKKKHIVVVNASRPMLSTVECKILVE